jgi:hypothetical protein
VIWVSANQGTDSNDDSSDWKIDSEYREAIEHPIQIQLRGDEETLFCKISLPAAADGLLSEEQRKREANAKLKRLLEGMGTVVKDLD